MRRRLQGQFEILPAADAMLEKELTFRPGVPSWTIVGERLQRRARPTGRYLAPHEVAELVVRDWLDLVDRREDGNELVVALHQGIVPTASHVAVVDGPVCCFVQVGNHLVWPTRLHEGLPRGRVEAAHVGVGILHLYAILVARLCFCFMACDAEAAVVPDLVSTEACARYVVVYGHALGYGISTHFAATFAPRHHRLALQERWAGARVYCADGVEDILAETGEAFTAVHHPMRSHLAEHLKKFLTNGALSRDRVYDAVVVEQRFQLIHAVLAHLRADALLVKCGAHRFDLTRVEVARR